MVTAGLPPQTYTQHARLADVRVMVTGGAGFIGSHVVDRLLDVDADVAVMDDLSTGTVGNLSGALAYGWQHWDRIGAMANPVGYLFRVGQSAARTDRRREGFLPVPSTIDSGNLFDRAKAP